MDEQAVFFGVLSVVYVAAAASFFALLVVSAPYGRHTRRGWGPEVGSRTGWILMESPSVFVFAAVYLAGDLRWQPVPLALAAMWLAHYLHRDLVYPFRLRRPGSPMPAAVVAMGFVFNVVNASLNARWISHLGPYDDGAGGGWWLWLGGAVFASGWVLNLWSDNRLLNLRRPGDTGYWIPRGGAFELVTCPNYLGEIVEWVGWAVASRSPAAVAFAVFTVANLVPRALSHHRWYRREFPDYPSRRRAVVPFLL